MNPALWTLIGLQLRGWLRHMGRGLRTVRGALLVLVGLVIFVPWVVSLLLLVPRGEGISPQGMRLYGPALLLLWSITNVLLSTSDKAVYFSPAEVNFLFPGPFGRREILAYRLWLNLIVMLPTALLLTVAFGANAPWLPAAFVGVLLILAFMQLFSTALGLVIAAAGERLYARGRRLVVLAVLVGGAVLVLRSENLGWQGGLSSLVQPALETPAWRALSWPLRCFFETFLAERLWPDLVAWAALSLLIEAGLLAIVFGMDTQYLESAAAASARTYARLQRLRGRSVSAEESRTTRRVRFGLPMLPAWGGVGPIVWRQLTGALRGMGRLLFAFAVAALVLLGPVLAAAVRGTEEADGGAAVAGVALPLVLWLTIFLTPLVPFDFRGDVDRLAALKTLPLPSWRLALGQLLVPVLVMSVLQGLVLAGVLAAAPAAAHLVAACAAYVLPFNFFLFALENALFLRFPTRLAAATPGDFQTMGRQFVFLFAKLLAMGGVAVLALGVFGLVWWQTDSLWGAVAAAWPVVALSGAALVPLVAWAFDHFDVGRDTPP